jgi:eukaryotic-like serine/threonine-protein kinase
VTTSSTSKAPKAGRLPEGLSGEEAEHLRNRILRFGLVSGSLGFLALLFRTPKLILSPGLPVETAAYVWHAAAASVGLTVALLCYSPRSTRTLRIIDACALPISALCYGLMGRAIAPAMTALWLAAQLTVLLAVSFGAFARAIYVPSSGRRTFAITAACLPGVIVAGIAGVGGELDAFGTPAPFTSIAGAVMWWTIATIVATLASNVVYGLRREVRTVRQYGQYTLEEKVGEGGMGVVYQASHAMLRRPTALKLLPPSRAGGGSVARFEKEVRLTARLTHPNTVTIFDYGRTPDGVFYYAMELLDGETLEDIVVTTGPFSAARVVRIGRQIAGALAEAHELGLVHRDVKPANIMLCATIGGESDIAKVLDFGLVRDQNADLGQTNTSAFAGTPLYMSPEAIDDPSAVSGSSDIYAVGAVLYYLLVGEPVFEATTTVEICASHLHQTPLAPSERTSNPIPPELDALVLSCLAKSPADRPASARELARALERIEKVIEGCACWDDTQATSWWTENRSAIALHRKQKTPKTQSRPSLATSRTLAVDFVRR